MTENEENSADKLPLEIVSQTLTYLSTIDIKNARLVNSLWYGASKQPAILKKQKFSFNFLTYTDQLDLILDTLENGGYQYYNLEFYKKDFLVDLEASKFLHFIKLNRKYIYSLSFVDCKFSFRMLEEIMITCENLKELIFIKCTCTDFEKATLIPNLEEKIVQKNLTFLEISRCHWLTNHVFNIFVSIYPNIKRLNFEKSKVRYFTSSDAGDKFGDSSEFNVNNLSRNYNVENLKALCLNDPIWDRWYEEEFDEFMSFPKLSLKELAVKGHYAVVIDKKLFSKQKYLKVLDIRGCRFGDHEDFKILFDRYPDLESLRFDFVREGHYIEEKLELLANSKLKILEINSLLFPKENVNFPNFKPNYNLYHLEIYGPCICNTLLSTMLQTFCCLTNLDLSETRIRGPKEELVNTIFQNQVKLKSLKLNRCSWVDDDVFKNCKLTNLERLELFSCRITEAAFHQFRFPNLKYLNLENCQEVTDAGITHLPQKCPLLYDLNVKATKISKKAILNILENLKHLHCINFQRAKKPPIISTEAISEHCPSLRLVEMNIEDTYGFNIFLKKWMKHVKIKPKCPCTACYPYGDN